MKVKIRMDLFKSIADGFLSTAGEFLIEAEIANLHCCGETITGETALRFLTDYLEGDRYFPAHHEHHNLQRARCQLRRCDLMLERLQAARERGDSAAAASSSATAG